MPSYKPACIFPLNIMGGRSTGDLVKIVVASTMECEMYGPNYRKKKQVC